MSDKNRKKPFIFKSLAALMTAALLVGCTPGEKGLGYAEKAQSLSEDNKQGNDENLQDKVEKAEKNKSKAEALERTEGSTLDTAIARYSTYITKYYQVYNQFLEHYNTVIIWVQTNDKDTTKLYTALHGVAYDKIDATIAIEDVVKHPIYSNAYASKKDKKAVERYAQLRQNAIDSFENTEKMMNLAFEEAANYLGVTPEDLYIYVLTFESPTQQCEPDGGIVKTSIEKGETLFRNGLCIVEDVGDVIKGAGYKAVLTTGADNDKEMKYAEEGLNRMENLEH